MLVGIVSLLLEAVDSLGGVRWQRLRDLLTRWTLRSLRPSRIPSREDAQTRVLSSLRVADVLPSLWPQESMRIIR